MTRKMIHASVAVFLIISVQWSNVFAIEENRHCQFSWFPKGILEIGADKSVFCRQFARVDSKP